jgi:uncharacterized protein YdhG (YjbR/CyaY superfamily)
MTKPAVKSANEYISSQLNGVCTILGLIRSTIGKVLPRADDVISYKIPAYKLHGRAVLYFAGWKEHYSLDPASGSLVAAFRDELAP